MARILKWLPASSSADDPVLAMPGLLIIGVLWVLVSLIHWWGLVLLLGAVIIAYGVYSQERDRKRFIRRSKELTGGFLAKWQGTGRDIILVYSEDPRWAPYITERWLPRLAERAVLVNLSEYQASSDLLEANLFAHFVGTRRFAPTLIRVSPDGNVQWIRFRRAFQNAAHGNLKILQGREYFVGLTMGVQLGGETHPLGRSSS